MVLTLAITAALGSGLAMVAYHLRKAPIGYEDESGFHIVPRVKGSAVVRHGRQHAPAGSLKSARAHS